MIFFCLDFLILVSISSIPRGYHIRYFINRKRFPCLHSLIYTGEGLGEFETVKQSRNGFEGLHNFWEFSQLLECLHQAMQTQEKSFYCFYKITSSKNYNAGKDLLIKTYLPTILKWQWDFSTDQSKLTFENLVVACLRLVYLYVTQPCLHTLMQTRLSANQSMCTI